MTCIHHYGGFLGSSVVKNPGDTSLSSESGRAPGEENGNLLQYSCLGDPMDRRAWWGTVPGVTRVRHAKAFDCVDYNKLWKILKEIGIPGHRIPVSWENCMWVKKQQLELYMEQQAGSKLGKEYVKVVYCHPAYLTYMQSTSCKMPGLDECQTGICQEAFNRRLPVCCFGSVRNPLFLINSWIFRN